MTAALVRRDPIVRSLWGWLLIIVGSVHAAMLMSGVEAWTEPGADWGRQAALIGLWTPLAIFQLVAGHTARGSGFDLGLPISGRRLWTTHLCVYLATGTVIACAVAAFDAAAGRLAAGLQGRAALPAHTLRLLPHAVGWFAVTGVLISGVRRERLRAGFSWGGCAYGLALMAAALGLLWWTGRWSPAFALVPLAIAAVLAVLLGRGVPPSLTEIPRRRGGARAIADPVAARAPSGIDRRLLPTRTIWLGLYGKAQPWGLHVPMLFYGWISSGHLQDNHGDPDGRAQMAWLAALMLLWTVLPALRRLAMFDALPISRRALFAVIALPGLLTLTAGYGLGRAVSALTVAPRERLLFTDDGHGAHQVRVPLQDFAIAWDGQPPAIVSPWGESCAPHVIPLQPGCRAVLYKPYTTTAGSSLDFVAMQIHRGMMAVYGTSLPPETIRTRYLALDDSGRVVPREGGLPLRADNPGLREHDGGPVLAVVLGIIGVPYLLLLAASLALLRRRSDERARMRVAYGALAVAVGGNLLYLGGGLVDAWDPDVHWAAVRILIHQASTAWPGGALLIWVVSLGALWACYRLAESRFARLEAPARVDAIKGLLIGRP